MAWEDLLDTLADAVTEQFGTDAQYQRAETGEVFDPVRVVFDPDYILQEASAKLGVGSRIIVADIKNADIGGEPAPDDLLMIKGESFRVYDITPSSSGMTKAHLRRR